MKVVWLDSAVEDLVRLRALLHEHSPESATRAAQKLVEAVNCLEEHPTLGRPLETLLGCRDLGIRLGAGGYILRYRIHAEIVYVMHIRQYHESGFD